MRLPNGLTIDNPAYPLLMAGIAYWGITDAAGNAAGTTLVCADLDNHPTYAGNGNKVKILTGGAWGQDREIMTHAAGGILAVSNPFTDNAGAAQQIAVGTLFVILSSSGGGGGAGPVTPSIGLWMFGVCDAAMVASTTDLYLTNLAGFPDDIFNDEFYVQVIHNDDNPGAPPEAEIRLITDYDGGTGLFVCDAFTANVEADDLVCVIHESLITPGLEVISTLVNASFNLLNAILVTTETGGTITTDGTVQNVYVNAAPAGVFKPLVVKIDTQNMAAGHQLAVVVNYQIRPGGVLEQAENVTFLGVQTDNIKTIHLDPNRYGIQVTLDLLAGANIDIDWEVIYDV